jgi:hypothetical protein
MRQIRVRKPKKTTTVGQLDLRPCPGGALGERSLADGLAIIGGRKAAR